MWRIRYTTSACWLTVLTSSYSAAMARRHLANATNDRASITLSRFCYRQPKRLGRRKRHRLSTVDLIYIFPRKDFHTVLYCFIGRYVWVKKIWYERIRTVTPPFYSPPLLPSPHLLRSKQRLTSVVLLELLLRRLSLRVSKYHSGLSINSPDSTIY